MKPSVILDTLPPTVKQHYSLDNIIRVSKNNQGTQVRVVLKDGSVHVWKQINLLWERDS